MWVSLQDNASKFPEATGEKEIDFPFRGGGGEAYLVPDFFGAHGKSPASEGGGKGLRKEVRFKETPHHTGTVPITG